MNFGLKKVMAPENEGMGGGSGGGGENIEALVRGIENTPSNDIPMHDPKQPAAAPQAQAPQHKEYAFDFGGKQIKIAENDPKFQDWLRRGYSYSQDMQKFKAERTQWDQERNRLMQIEKRFADVDKFAQENPQWWEFVQKQYDQRLSNANAQAQLDPNNPLVQEIQTLRQQIQDFSNFKNEITTEKQQEIIAQQDAQLESDIKSIRDQYSNLDFDTPDANGKDLITQTMEYASQKGISDFKSAFLAFNYDRLVQLAVEKAKVDKEKVDLQNKQAGVIGQTNQPTKGLPDLNIKNMNHNQIHERILQDLGVN